MYLYVEIGDLDLNIIMLNWNVHDHNPWDGWDAPLALKSELESEA